MKKNKKALLIIIGIVALFFPVRITLRDGGTVVYNALTYKVIIWNEYNITYEDNYKTGTEVHIFPMNFKSVKYYSEVAKGEMERNFGVAKIIEEKNTCIGKEEIFYQDDNKEYFFTCPKSQYITVVFKDETTMPLMDAIAQNKVTLSDLNASAIYYEERDRFQEGSKEELDNFNNEYLNGVE